MDGLRRAAGGAAGYGIADAERSGDVSRVGGGILEIT